MFVPHLKFIPGKTLNSIGLINYLHTMKILLLESFYTSSHKQWADGLIANSKHDIQLLALPGRHWKWRMHHAGIHFGQEIVNLNTKFEAILCSDFMNVAEFRGFLNTFGMKGSWYNNVPIITYFHENQITYPWSENDPDIHLKRDNHYGWINYMSCICSDKVVFNSQFHKKNFIESLPDFLKQFPKTQSLDYIEKIKSSSSVLPIGLHLNALINHSKPNNEIPIVLWNHRWEYDKNPELFFESLFELKSKNIKFKLVILGERYKHYPPVFDLAKEKLADEIIHFGYAESREHYLDLLLQADILPVTSNQDFFGISAVEAIAAGAVPILPRRLAFPEHLDSPKFQAHYYNNSRDFTTILVKTIAEHPYKNSDCRTYISKYDWDNVATQYDAYFDALAPHPDQSPIE